jgi:hypothetical protein
MNKLIDLFDLKSPISLLSCKNLSGIESATCNGFGCEENIVTASLEDEIYSKIRIRNGD